MIILDRLLLGGLKFVLARIAEAVDAELNDPERLRESLLAAQMQLELGELTPEEFARIERELLARRREQGGGAAGPGAGYRVTGVEARTWDEE